MMRSSGVFVLLFSCTLLLVMGALDRQPTGFSSVAGAAFVTQASCRSGLQNLTPRKSCARRRQPRSRQTCSGCVAKSGKNRMAEEMSFEADGRLVRGPNQCGRFEMTVRPGESATELITVSDGSRPGPFLPARPGKPAQVSHSEIPTAGRQAIVVRIRSKPSCTPMVAPALTNCSRTWRRGLRIGNSATGTWKNRAILRLTGSVKNARRGAARR